MAQDKAFVARNPNSAYCLRVKLADDGVGAHQLPGAIGPAHARHLASRLGFEPTHWTNPDDSRRHLF